MEEDPMLNTLSSLLKVEKKKKSNQKNNQTTNTKTRQTKKGWFLRFRRTQSQNHPSGVTSSAFICTFSAKGKHGVASCWSCFTCPGNHFPQWELYPVKEIGLVNTKAVCSALTASPERKNEVLLSSQRLLYAKKCLENQQKRWIMSSRCWQLSKTLHTNILLYWESWERLWLQKVEALVCLAGTQRNHSEPELEFHYGPKYIHYIHKVYVQIHTLK